MLSDEASMVVAVVAEADDDAMSRSEAERSFMMMMITGEFSRRLSGEVVAVELAIDLCHLLRKLLVNILVMIIW